VDILIEELNGGVWVAGVQEKRLNGLEFDPPSEEVRWGSIYWAKVARIDKAQDAAYVNLDGDNIGILYNADVRVEKADGIFEKGGKKEIGKTLRPGQMVAVQAKSSFFASSEQEFAKADGKVPKVSMDISLPGRYLIFNPMEPENLVSKRVQDSKARAQMQNMLESLSDFHGCILRLSAADTQTDFLVREAKILASMWQQMSAFFKGDGPQLITMGPDAIQRMLSDHASQSISRIEVTTMDHFQMAEEWCDIYAPDMIPRIHPVEMSNAANEFALFEHYDLIPQIDGLMHPYVILSQGATIIMQETAAFLAVDVNSAADSRSKAEINKEAAYEIARQMRIRNLGGAVVIDFLKTNNKKERTELVKIMTEAVNDDPCTIQVHGLTNLGFMEMTRMRRTPEFSVRYLSMNEM